MGRCGTTSVTAPVFVVLRILFRALVPFLVTSVVSGKIGANSVCRVCGINKVVVMTTFLNLLTKVTKKHCKTGTSANFTGGLEGTVFSQVRACSFTGVSRFDATKLMAHLAASMAGIRGTCRVVLHVVVETPTDVIYTVIVTFTVGTELTDVCLITILVLKVVLFFVVHRTATCFRRTFPGCSTLGRSIRRGMSTVHIIGTCMQRSRRADGFGHTDGGVCSVFMGTRGGIV